MQSPKNKTPTYNIFFFTLLHKALILHYVDIFVQIVIQERRLHIYLMDFEVHRCPDCKDALYGGEFGQGCKGLIKINSMNLCKALCH